ncbi:hypothetical protein DEU56DRAFT_981124 [Suillus clintonianus]|uniref:uncharacterized protein n=1 Tax=Suillus clintonianus TaxID=1904413 RepID=UPI001B874546|nr:uncharacterized protein DEU56DRAFT_981124 [Suillus clintonianus]KAG2135502.1 hypothetical protein DEU56DRAFT_981124 [Suillus clintonianus]
MHPALRNLEVLCTISSYTKRSSLPALASTCREFEHPALDVLWRNLQSVTPLVSCLPSGLFQTSGKGLALQKPADGKVWDAFFKYSSRVHSITAIASLSILGTLSLLMLSCPSTPAFFFPNLRKLSLHDDGGRSTAEFLRMACVPSLVELDLQIHSASSPALLVLSSLGTLCPHLQCMTVTLTRATDDSLRKISPFITQPVSQLHHLHTLSVCDLGNKSIEYLMQLRALQSLSLDFNGSSSWDIRPDTQLPGFHDLKFLGLSARTVERASNFFSSFQIVRSKEIKVEFIYRVAEFSASGSEMLSQFFAILQERCDNDKLESFSLVGLSKRIPTEFGIFISLRAFRNLTRLVIENGCDIPMSDEELCQLAKAWPKLQVLKFSRYANTIAVPTFHGLMGLLRLCPALTSLALVIDTTELDGIDLKRPGGGLCNKHLKFLALGNSPMESPLNVAVIIGGLFPRLEQVQPEPWSSDRWTLVNSFLDGFRLVREQRVEACVCSDI